MYQWRPSTPTRAKRSPPAGFILPAQPTLSSLAPSGPEWLHELKHDGWRLIARKAGRNVRLWSRQAKDVTEWFTGVAEAIAALPVESGLFDGEAVVWRPDGHSDFAALQSRAGASRAVMVAFDMIELRGVDLRRQPIEERRGELEQLAGQHAALLFSQSIGGDGPLVFEHACLLGAEGIISKRRGSAYRSGRVDAWRKIKFAGFVRR